MKMCHLQSECEHCPSMEGLIHRVQYRGVVIDARQKTNSLSWQVLNLCKLSLQSIVFFRDPMTIIKTMKDILVCLTAKPNQNSNVLLFSCLFCFTENS